MQLVCIETFFHEKKGFQDDIKHSGELHNCAVLCSSPNPEDRIVIEKSTYHVPEGRIADS